MTDFSATHQHIADGRAAAEKVIAQLITEHEAEAAELAEMANQEAQAALVEVAPAPVRRSSMRLWDRRNHVA